MLQVIYLLLTLRIFPQQSLLPFLSLVELLLLLTMNRRLIELHLSILLLVFDLILQDCQPSLFLNFFVLLLKSILFLFHILLQLQHPSLKVTSKGILFLSHPLILCLQDTFETIRLFVELQ